MASTTREDLQMEMGHLALEMESILEALSHDMAYEIFRSLLADKVLAMARLKATFQQWKALATQPPTPQPSEPRPSAPSAPGGTDSSQ